MTYSGIDKMVRSVNMALGKHMVDVEDDCIVIDSKSPFAIVCEDEDDVFNTLSNMLTGIILLREAEKGGFNSEA